MAQTSPVTVWGVHSVTLFDRATFLPVTKELKVIGEFTLPFEASIEPLYGGSNRFAWEAEAKTFNTDVTMTLKQFDETLYNALSGATIVTGSAEASGFVTTATNIKGTSLIASTGLASVSLKSGKTADLKAGIYVLKVASATTIDAYALTTMDFSAGSALTVQDDAMKITATPITITTGGAVEIPYTGIQMTGGAGTVAMTIGDTAMFEVRPANVANSQVTIGAGTTILNKYGLQFSAMKKSTGEVWYGYAPKIQVSGFNTPLKEMAWANGSDKLTMMYDSNYDAVCYLRRSTRVLG